MLRSGSPLTRALALASVGVLLASGSAVAQPASSADRHANGAESGHHRHVLLLSIDGLHASDLAWWVRTHPSSALAELSGMGVTYGAASSARPSDSFPGLLAMLTGGGPNSTGVWYNVSYDRKLAAPGSDCSTLGTVVVYDESIDYNPDAVDAGGGIDPALLPLDPAHGCTPVYPHSYLRVNTIFNVVHNAGRRTAWADKHPSYELVNGPTGDGVTDLYTPEVASIPKTNPATEGNDDLKVSAILHEINGYDHTGTTRVGTPAVFGMNFQAVSVAQKDGSGESVPAAGGYSADGLGTPRAQIVDALTHTDSSIAQMVAALRHRRLFESTLIILTAKHGQSPIDRSQSVLIEPDGITSAVTSAGVGVASLTADDAAFLWLNPSSTTSAADTNTAVKALRGAAGLRLGEILAGDSLTTKFNAPGVGPGLDPRVPDVIGLPEQGVIYASPKPGAKIAEHGGFAFDDTNVALLVANPDLRTRSVKSAVETTQIAPTILAFLGLDPSDLKAVRMEHTTRLPGLAFGH